MTRVFVVVRDEALADGTHDTTIVKVFKDTTFSSGHRKALDYTLSQPQYPTVEFIIEEFVAE